MPAYVVTAVDTSANTLTATGVAPLPDALNMNPSLVTGDRFRLRNVGGALPAATPALAQGTDYWAIRVSQDVIKVATSQANALAGVAVDITGSLGAGTTTIEYQLPYALPTAASAKGTQIHAVDNNTTWSALVALYDLLTAQSQSVFNGVQLAGALTAAGDIKTTGGRLKHGTLTQRFGAVIGLPQNQASVWTNNGGSVDGTPLAVWAVPINLPDGKRITAMRARVKDSATGPTKLQFTAAKGVDDTVSDIGGGSVLSAGSGAWQTLSRTGLSVTVTSGETYYGSFVTTTGTSLTRIAWVEVDYDDL